MSTQCAHTLNNGKLCNAPTVNGSRFCRHHDPQRPQKAANENFSDSEPLALPPLLDKPSILAAVNEVIQALAAGRIKRSVAETLLSAIRLANRLLNEITEAGLTPLPVAPTHHVNTRLADNRTAVALAASGDRRSPAVFTSAHRSHESDIDPATAQFVKALVAQSRDLAQTSGQKPRS